MGREIEKSALCCDGGEEMAALREMNTQCAKGGERRGVMMVRDHFSCAANADRHNTERSPHVLPVPIRLKLRAKA